MNTLYTSHEAKVWRLTSMTSECKVHYQRIVCESPDQVQEPQNQLCTPLLWLEIRKRLVQAAPRQGKTVNSIVADQENPADAPPVGQPVHGGVLGITVTDWSQGGVRGLEVVEIGDDSSGQIAGLRTGYVITDLNGVHIKSAQELDSILSGLDQVARSILATSLKAISAGCRCTRLQYLAAGIKAIDVCREKIELRRWQLA